MTSGVYKRTKPPWNKGLKGIHLSPKSEFKKGCKSLNKGKRSGKYIKCLLCKKEFYVYNCNIRNKHGVKYCSKTCYGRSIRKKKKGRGNPMWKGNSVKIGPLHDWVRWNKPKQEFCECCGIKPPKDLANISQKYKRDINDFEWLCHSCHMKQHSILRKLEMAGVINGDKTN